MKAFLKYLLIMILIIGISEVGVAQKKHRQRARTAIKELKEGILIVTIPTFQKKIDTLQSLLKKDLKEKERLWLNDQLTEAKELRDIAPSNIQGSFRTAYDFSEVLFIDDTSMVHLRKGNYDGIFINADAPKDFEDRNFFVHKPSVMQRTAVLRDATLDKDFIPLEHPFPSVVRRRYMIMDFYEPKTDNPLGYEYVKAINTSFWIYYKNAIRKRWWFFFRKE